MPVINPSGGGSGGSQPQTATATLTTNANTFVVSHVFDLGHATSAYIKMTALALAPDGETFGSGPGNIQADMNLSPALFPAGVSRDNVTYYSSTPAVALQLSPVDTVAAVLDEVAVIPRYLKVGVFIYDVNSGLVYAGANHPTAQVRLDIEYL